MSHLMPAAMQLDDVLSMIMQQQTYDYLGLKANPLLQTFISKKKKSTDEPNETILFSDEVVKVNRKDKRQMRHLVVTTTSLYNFAPDVYKEPRREIDLTHLIGIVVSERSDEVVFQVQDSYDYRFAVSRRVDLLKALHRAFDDMSKLAEEKARERQQRPRSASRSASAKHGSSRHDPCALVGIPVIFTVEAELTDHTLTRPEAAKGPRPGSSGERRGRGRNFLGRLMASVFSMAAGGKASSGQDKSVRTSSSTGVQEDSKEDPESWPTNLAHAVVSCPGAGSGRRGSGSTSSVSCRIDLGVAISQPEYLAILSGVPTKRAGEEKDFSLDEIQKEGASIEHTINSDPRHKGDNQDKESVPPMFPQSESLAPILRYTIPDSLPYSEILNHITTLHHQCAMGHDPHFAPYPPGILHAGWVNKKKRSLPPSISHSDINGMSNEAESPLMQMRGSISTSSLPGDEPLWVKKLACIVSVPHPSSSSRPPTVSKHLTGPSYFFILLSPKLKGSFELDGASVEVCPTTAPLGTSVFHRSRKGQDHVVIHGIKEEAPSLSASGAGFPTDDRKTAQWSTVRSQVSGESKDVDAIGTGTATNTLCDFVIPGLVFPFASLANHVTESNAFSSPKSQATSSSQSSNVRPPIASAPLVDPTLSFTIRTKARTKPMHIGVANESARRAWISALQRHACMGQGHTDVNQARQQSCASVTYEGFAWKQDVHSKTWRLRYIILCHSKCWYYEMLEKVTFPINAVHTATRIKEVPNTSIDGSLYQAHTFTSNSSPTLAIGRDPSHVIAHGELPPTSPSSCSIKVSSRSAPVTSALYSASFPHTLLVSSNCIYINGTIFSAVPPSSSHASTSPTSTELALHADLAHVTLGFTSLGELMTWSFLFNEVKLIQNQFIPLACDVNESATGAERKVEVPSGPKAPEQAADRGDVPQSHPVTISAPGGADSSEQPSQSTRPPEEPLNNKNEVQLLPAALLDSLSEVAPTGKVALVFTDVESSTSLWESHAEAMAIALELHDQILRLLIRLCRGYEVKTEGDAFFVAFFSAADAVEWCIQTQLKLMNADWPTPLEHMPSKPVQDGVFRGLRVRMGIHFGVPNCRRNPITGRMDYFGPDVNLAARIADSAHGGQIICSPQVLEELSNDQRFTLKVEQKALGEYTYKGISFPVPITQIALPPLSLRHFPQLRTTKYRREIVKASDDTDTDGD